MDKPDWWMQMRQQYLAVKRNYPKAEAVCLYLNEDHFLQLTNKKDFNHFFDVSKNKITMSGIKTYLVRGGHPPFRFVVY